MLYFAFKGYYVAMKKIFTIEKGEGLRLDKFFIKELSEYSRTFLQKLIKQDLISVNGKRAKQSYSLKIGDVVAVEIPEKEEI